MRETSFSFEGAETVKRLLDVAIEAVPPHLWKKTPVVLKATAGLRLLSEEKAQALLLEVILRSFGYASIALPVSSFMTQFAILFSRREFQL